MIYTYTLNPSIDYVMHVDAIQFGATNRSTSEIYKIGGKGINVSVVLNNLAIKNRASGFLGGFSGNFIDSELKKYQHIENDFVHTELPTRINIKIKQDVETEINGSGAAIPEDAIEALWQQIRNLPDDAFVVLSGSLAKGVPESIYIDICQYLKSRNIGFVVDTASATLLDIAKLGPVLIKPNREELEAFYNSEFADDQALIAAGKRLHADGAQHVIISLGGKGSMLICEQGIYRATVPKGTLVDSVGAGDSMIAGFVYGFTIGMSAVESFRYAAAAGSATAYSRDLATKDAINTLKDDIEIVQL
ncbi:1-phosphofructokinase [Culicoidibacter larvae]|uniref:Tagatose-6-phosphate kinase n=1 Tax=Culicoidibacter larvae TaxID=2579976 RepID=A0A5R8Q7W6_9FIRM|nr:1-phosphofructokinase [Culicoidibacter larvae]TLG71231.1 1-phosphofructokinase [Culicoidibacter larvae]